MTSRDATGAAISLGAHGAALLLLWALAPERPPPAEPRRAAKAAGLATRVALLGRAPALSAGSAAAVAPAAERPAPPRVVVLRNRGPVRRQPVSVDPEFSAGEPESSEAFGAAGLEGALGGGSSGAEAGAAEGGDGLAGVLAHSANALGGDPRAAIAAPAEARVALERPAPDLSRLQAKLTAAAARCYPEGARRFRQSGVTTLEFCLDARGALVRSSVKQSSGSGLLDGAAQGCVLQGALPAGPEVGQGCFALPVRFGGAR